MRARACSHVCVPCVSVLYVCVSCTALWGCCATIFRRIRRDKRHYSCRAFIPLNNIKKSNVLALAAVAECVASFPSVLRCWLLQRGDNGGGSRRSLDRMQYGKSTGTGLYRGSCVILKSIPMNNGDRRENIQIVCCNPSPIRYFPFPFLILKSFARNFLHFKGHLLPRISKGIESSSRSNRIFNM